MKSGKLTLWEATALAVGIIIGSSIFSLIGVGAGIAGSNLPLAFVISALVALLVAYNYAKLGSTYVSNAGPIEFIVRGLGDGMFTGVAAFMLWFIYVASIALFVKTFTGYLLALTGLGTANAFLFSLVEVVVITAFTSLNFFGSKAVGRTESIIVAVKIGILGIFILAGIWTVNPTLITPSLGLRPLSNTAYAATLFFLSYTGFGLITNASENMENPRKNVPRAIYLSLAIASAIYVLVSLVAVGNVPLNDLVSAQEYALAEASRPFLGTLGFTLVSLGALFSTGSALNASLYGGANVAYALAKKGELPHSFERKVWFGEPEGLYITSLIGILMVLFLDLEGIAAVCSASFMLIYLGVILSHIPLAGETGARRWIVVLSLISVLTIFVILIYNQFTSNPSTFLAILLSIGVAVTVEYAIRRSTGRGFRVRHHHAAG
jgi:amino acid transporter